MSALAIHGHDVEAVLRALEQVEAGRFGDARRRRGQLRRLGNSLLDQRYLTGQLLPVALGLRSARGVPAPMRRYNAYRLLRAGLFGPAVASRSAAQALYFKRNVRAFYTRDQHLTVKLPAGGPQPSDLRHEVQTRADVDRTRTVRLPRVLEYQFAAPAFLAEELIVGSTPRDAGGRAAVTDQLLPALCRFYEAWGTSEARCGDVLDLAGFRDGAAGAIASLPPGEPGSRERLERWVGGLDGLAGAVLPGSFGHGDLSLGNMLADERGGVWLLDWETARPMPVMWDWRKLFGHLPNALAVYERFLTRLYGGKLPQHVMPLADQLRVVRTARLAETFGQLVDPLLKPLDAQRRLRAAYDGLVAVV